MCDTVAMAISHRCGKLLKHHSRLMLLNTSSTINVIKQLAARDVLENEYNVMLRLHHVIQTTNMRMAKYFENLNLSLYLKRGVSCGLDYFARQNLQCYPNVCGLMQRNLHLTKGTASDGLAYLVRTKTLATFVMRGLHLPMCFLTNTQKKI